MAIPKPQRIPGVPEVVPTIDAAIGTMQGVFDLMEAHPEIKEGIGVAQVGNPISVQAVPSPDQWVAKQLRRAQASGQDWLDGVKNPSASFKDAALAAKGKYIQRTQDSLTNKTWEKSMAKVDVDQAIATAEKVGPQGYVNGITAREGKIRAKVAVLQPLVAAVKGTIQSMPQDTDQQREARMLAARRGMIEVGKRMKGA